MAVLPILKAPDPRLKTKSKPVAQVDEGVRKLVADMIETMYAANGIGLAAIQVGIPKRILVIDLAREGEAPNPQVFINPEILEQSEDLATYEEGCLSVPEHYAEVVRPATVRVRYLDGQGEIREQEATGLLATCLQHEMDHLDGVLFVDHLSLVKRSVILRKLAKAKKLATV
ncbi:peptide deformylase [Zavarzinia sp. CC-PAN008]|uniref:peptide deformylase n=1 Tax=Zavarzinia sp. CC-PAN008 TaxID=3243332 RepID=UPI003F745156